MHEAARHEGEDPGNDEGADEERGHGGAVRPDPARPRQGDGLGEAREGGGGEEMDRAPAAPGLRSRDEEGRERDETHQADPEPPEDAVGGAALAPDQQGEPEPEGGQGGERVDLDRGSGREERGERHDDPARRRRRLAACRSCLRG